MAIITAVKAGNWSDPTVWDSGSLPGLGDTAKPGAFAVVIDQNVDLGSGALEGTAGLAGYFRVNASGITITCDHVTNTNTWIVQYYHASGQCYLNADILAGTVSAKDCVKIFAAGGLTVVGDIAGGDVATSAWGLVSQVAGEPITITGNVRSGLAANSVGLYVLYNRGVTINGNITSGGAYGAALYYQSSGVTINGDVRAVGVGSAAFSAIVCAASPTVGGVWRLTVNGDVYAYEDGVNPFGAGNASAISPNPGAPVICVVNGHLYDGPLGTPAVAVRVFRSVSYPQPYIDLPYIDPATDEITTERLWRRPGRILPIRGGLG